MIICNRNKNYMKYWLFWWLNFGTLKQFMMTMPFLTSIQLCLNSLSSDLHLPILLLFLGNQLKAETVRLAISPHPVQQSRIWLNCPAAGKNPGILHKRNFLVSDNTTDFEKTTIQAHSAVRAQPRLPPPALLLLPAQLRTPVRRPLHTLDNGRSSPQNLIRDRYHVQDFVKIHHPVHGTSLYHLYKEYSFISVFVSKENCSWIYLFVIISLCMEIIR